MQPIRYHWTLERVPVIFQWSSSNRRLVSKRTNFRQFSESAKIFLCILYHCFVSCVLSIMYLYALYNLACFVCFCKIKIFLVNQNFLFIPTSCDAVYRRGSTSWIWIPNIKLDILIGTLKKRITKNEVQ